MALNTTHGMTGTPVYAIWKSMVARCHNPSDDSFSQYGGRGIRVCDEWRRSFERLFDDMGDRPNGLTLERKDNSKGYGPDNCKWATYQEQARNTRRNRVLEHKGRSQCLAEWSEELGIPRERIAGRLGLGWSVAESLYGRG